jgi:hypothetical protein
MCCVNGKDSVVRFVRSWMNSDVYGIRVTKDVRNGTLAYVGECLYVEGF